MKRLLAALSPLVLLATPAPSLDLATDAKDRVLRNLPVANSAAQPASGEWAAGRNAAVGALPGAGAFAVSNGQAAIEQRQKLKQTGNPCGGPCGETGGPASGSIGTSQSGTVSGDAIAKNGVAAGWGHNQGITSAAVSHSGASATNGHSVQTGSTAQVIR
jgi:hypothetical protein